MYNTVYNALPTPSPPTTVAPFDVEDITCAPPACSTSNGVTAVCAPPASSARAQGQHRH